MANVINWFEIPAANFDRAVKFYNQVLGAELTPFDNEARGLKMGFFPAERGVVGGCVTHGKGYKPSAEGALVYLNGGDDLGGPLSRVEKAGGKVEMPKTKLSDEVGYMAIFIDSEGNRVALHSMK